VQRRVEQAVEGSSGSSFPSPPSVVVSDLARLHAAYPSTVFMSGKISG